MGSMLKFDSERRELVRERRDARIQRKHERRQALARKRTEITGLSTDSGPFTLRASFEGPSGRALPEQAPEPARSEPRPVIADKRPAPTTTTEQPRPAIHPRGETSGRAQQTVRISRRERDIAQFREHREHVVKEARKEAQERIRRAGEPASVADAMGALAHPSARCWLEQHQQLESALQAGRITEIGAQARRSLWTVSRDAARSSHRAKRDPELALAVCVAYAIIARLPRTALASEQRNHPTPATPRAFWR